MRAAWDGWLRSCSPTVRALRSGARRRMTRDTVRPACCPCATRPAPTSGSSPTPAAAACTTPSASNLADHVFLMDGVKVAEVFPPLMARNFQMLQEDWPTNVKPFTGADFDVDAVARWYLHQANGVVVRQAIEMLGLPPERVPISVDHYGNTSAASTLILLDEDRRAGRVTDGDLVVFMWIGAGNGAMNGYAAGSALMATPGTEATSAEPDRSETASKSELQRPSCLRELHTLALDRSSAGAQMEIHGGECERRCKSTPCSSPPLGSRRPPDEVRASRGWQFASSYRPALRRHSGEVWIAGMCSFVASSQHGHRIAVAMLVSAAFASAACSRHASCRTVRRSRSCCDSSTSSLATPEDFPDLHPDLPVRQCVPRGRLARQPVERCDTKIAPISSSYRSSSTDSTRRPFRSWTAVRLRKEPEDRTLTARRPWLLSATARISPPSTTAFPSSRSATGRLTKISTGPAGGNGYTHVPKPQVARPPPPPVPPRMGSVGKPFSCLGDIA